VGKGSKRMKKKKQVRPNKVLVGPKLYGMTGAAKFLGRKEEGKPTPARESGKRRVSAKMAPLKRRRSSCVGRGGVVKKKRE